MGGAALVLQAAVVLFGVAAPAGQEHWCVAGKLVVLVPAYQAWPMEILVN
ncbi:MAG: hypothetical protein ACP5E5_05780 [Acidobacteriaceae bacterium]